MFISANYKLETGFYHEIITIISGAAILGYFDLKYKQRARDTHYWLLEDMPIFKFGLLGGCLPYSSLFM
jgi:rhamnose utilization protein RhaD (predicted bifunctional aldolase and dehydrogenase)